MTSSHLHDLAHSECAGQLSSPVLLDRLATPRTAFRSATLARIVRQQLACTVATALASRLSWQKPLKRAVSRTRALTPSRRNAPRRLIRFSTSCSFMPADPSRPACHSSNSPTVRLFEATKKNPVFSSLPT